MWRIVLSVLLLSCTWSTCIHDTFVQNTTKHYLNSSMEARLLQNAGEEGRLRIFVDYTQLYVGGTTEVNLIKRVTNITANYFAKVLTVKRLERLYFPEGTSRQCKHVPDAGNSLMIPEQYVTDGTIGDIGVVCGNENNPNAVYVAKSTPCAFLESDNRPIWGMMSWNVPFLKYDQEGFQQNVFVGIHEMTHILGFSAVMYPQFPTGNLLVQDAATGDNYISSQKILEVMRKHYNCTNPKGMLLEDQDGTLIASHWEHKVIGNEYMIASNQKNSFVSQFTLAFFESMGWYPTVNYDYAEPSVWGKDRGCQFLNIDDCEGEEFCTDSSFGCDWDGTAIGRCRNTPFTGSCRIFKHYTNTICVDQNYQLKNLNSRVNAFERGGSNARCFGSDYRQEGIAPTKLNNRCYVAVCSISKRFIFILVGSYILVCHTEGQVIKAPAGLEGTLTCPESFPNYCDSKRTCPYHCNKNGGCIDGQCLCTGELELTQSCLDISIFNAPIGSTGGLLQNLNDQTKNLNLDESGQPIGNSIDISTYQPKVKQYSINSKCIQGTAFDFIFGECLPCDLLYFCKSCDDQGCISCDDGTAPQDGRCNRRR